MYWLHALVLGGLTGLALRLTGGRPWLKYFLFPVAFLLVSVPWPKEFENAIVQNLMRWVAGATVEVLAILGIPALRHGATLQISSGMVGVDEACSGVRSLQTGIMIGLFLGEFYFLSRSRRFLAVLAAVGTALIANVGRTTFLTWTAARFGLEKMNSWHDAAGAAGVVATLAATWGLIVLLRPKPPIAIQPAGKQPCRSPSPGSFRCL